MNPIIAQYADIIDSVNDARSLLPVEKEVQEDDFLDAGDKATILHLLAEREKLLLGSDADAERALRADRLRSMWAALKSLGVKGSGVNISQRISNGKRVPLKGGGFDVPSGGSGRGDDSTQGALGEFLDKFIRPNLSEGYIQPGRGDGSKPKLLGGKELLDTEGVVPPDAAQSGMNQFILEGGEDGAFDAETIDAIAARFNLSKTATSKARGAARKFAKGDASPEAAAKKAKASVANKVVGAAIKAARVAVAEHLDPERAARKAELSAKFRAVPSAGAAGAGDDGGDDGTGPTKDDKKRAADEARQHRDEGKVLREQETDRRKEEADKRKAQAEAQRKAREGRAELDAVMKASHASGGISDEQYEKYLSEKSFDSALSSGERRSATSRLGGLGAKRTTKAARESAQEEAGARRAEDRQQRDEGWYLRDQEKKRKEEEAEEKKRNPEKKRGSFDLYKASLLSAEFAASFRSGVVLGGAVGAVAQGLDRAVLGAAGAFVRAGQTALGLFLSPFGQAGGALASLAGGIGSTLLGVLGAAGGVAVAGVKIGAMIAGGIAGGLGAGLGAAAGAIVGTMLGIGPLAGAVAGAGLFTAIASAATALLSGIGGAVGSALSAIGSAFGEVGKGVGDFLGNVKSVLQDLIETAGKSASASLSTQRNSGMTLGAASETTALSQILTGGPGAFNGLFQNFGMMGMYQPARNGAFGVGGTGQNFTENLVPLFKKWSSFGDSGMGAMQKRIMLSVVAPGAQDTVGNLFSLGKDMVQKVVATARQVKMTPGEVKQDAVLSMNLLVIQAQLDRLKSKFLTDLMPAISLGLDLFGKFFAANEAKITSGLASFGKWMATEFPGLLRVGINGVFEFAASLAAGLPSLADFGKSVYATFASITNGVKGFLSAMLNFLVPVLGAVAGIVPGAGETGKALFGAAVGLNRTKDLDPNALNGMFDKIAAASPGLVKTVRDAQGKTNGFLDGAGVHNMSQQGFDQYVRNSQRGGPMTVDVHIKADLTVKPHEESFNHLEEKVGNQIMRGMIRGQQRASN